MNASALIRHDEMFVIALLCSSLFVTHDANAATWTDPDTKYTWTYNISGTIAVLENGYQPAISPTPTGKITIPSTLGGRPVLCIGDYAFRNCGEITGITIPDNATTIGEFAFDRCTNLVSVGLPRTIRTIKRYAFSDCVKLESFSFPDWVTTIDESVLSGCRSLKIFSIGKGVTTIKSWALKDCSSLWSLNIPNNVTRIDTGAFEGCNGFTSVSIPQYVCTNFFRAFFHSSIDSISSVTINSGVTTISGCFRDCGGKFSVTIPDTVEEIGDDAFENCGGISLIKIPSSVLAIGDDAFASCSNLVGITIPNSVTNIGDEAFYNCKNLLSATIGTGVTKIGTAAFAHCGKLMNVKVPGNVIILGSDSFSHCGKLKTATIGSGVTSIGSGAFGECEALSKIVIPSSVTNIGDYAFYNCTNLATVSIPSSIMSTGFQSFRGCTNVVNATVPGWDCGISFDSVVDLVISDGTKSIPRQAFDLCPQLSKVTIPNSVTNIGIGAFCNNQNLREINVAKSNNNFKSEGGILLTKDGTQILAAPGSVQNVTIPSEVTSIWPYAFCGCSNLLRIMFDGNKPSVGDYAFKNVGGDCTAYVTMHAIGWDVTIPGYWMGVRIRYMEESYFPEISLDKSLEAVFEGFADSHLSINLTNLMQYSQYRHWALSVTNDCVTTQVVKDSSNAWLSYALGTDSLITKAITSDDVKIETFTPIQADGMYEFMVSVKDVNIGCGTISDSALRENLQKVLGVEGAITLVDDAFSSDNVTVVFGTPQNGKARLMVAPRNEKAESLFMKVRVR